jgi:hypothetical protein
MPKKNLSDFGFSMLEIISFCQFCQGDRDALEAFGPLVKGGALGTRDPGGGNAFDQGTRWLGIEKLNLLLAVGARQTLGVDL